MNSKSLYAKYILERENKSCLETEDGFATYVYNEDYVYIEDIYVVPEKRKENIAASLADKIAEEAKAKGYKKMVGSVVPYAKGATNSLKVLLAYGMRLSHSNEHIIYFTKEL